jgi:hypothetical protein
MISPLRTRVLNAGLRAAMSVGAVSSSLERDELEWKAVRVAASSDFGSDEHSEGLVLLLECLEKEARLNPVGRLIARTTIVISLVKRLRMIEYRKKRREMVEQRIQRPLFILGLPRTGTTILYELLAQDPDHRCPMAWEVEDPVPPPRRPGRNTDWRVIAAQIKLGLLDWLAPGFKVAHETGALLPQECICLFMPHFMSEAWPALFRMPTYRSWLLRSDARSAYAWHRSFLQHLQVDLRRPRWLLKAPAHLAHVGALLAEYPDAAVIQTHRDPSEVMASLSSVELMLRRAFSDHVDPYEIGRETAMRCSEALARGVRDRDAHEREHSFFDVQFHDILHRPLDVIEDLYSHFGFELHESIRGQMQRYLDKRPRYKHGRHRYSLEQFGLASDELAEDFRAYRERFGLA